MMAKAIVPNQQSRPKKTGHDFSKFTEHSTWSLLTGCFDPFVHYDAENQPGDKQETRNTSVRA